MATQTFEDPQIWKQGNRPAVHAIRMNMARNVSGLRDQIQRAAISAPSNVAEGNERDSKLDFVRFLRMAKGSNAELRTPSGIPPLKPVTKFLQLQPTRK